MKHFIARLPITPKIFPFPPVRYFPRTSFDYIHPLLFVYFLPTSPIPCLQVSSECTLSMPQNPLYENKLLRLIPLMLLLASISLIHSIHGLVGRIDYSFTRALFTFRNYHHHCAWKSSDITMMPHSSDITAAPKPSN